MIEVQKTNLHITSKIQQFNYIGNIDLLNLPKHTLICSRNTPADQILPTIQTIWHWRDTNQAVISGFHSPMEKECLTALLRGTSPIIICPARSITNMKIPKEWFNHLNRGLMLIISPFNNKRADSKTAKLRNELLVYFADTAPLHCQFS